MATSASKTAVPAQADKALARQIAQIDDMLDNTAEFLDLMRDTAAKAPFAKDLVELRKRVEAVGESRDKPRAAGELVALGKEAKALVDRASRASQLAFAQHQWRELRAKAAGLLAQALVAVGQIDPPAMRAPLQKDQQALKSELDRAEKLNDLLKANAAFDAIVLRVEALLKRLDRAAVNSAWLKAGYEPLVARVQSAVRRVGAERARKTLLAEIDFIGVDVNKALLKGDVRAVQSRALPQHLRLERVAARIVALSPSLDRELARIARLVKGRPDAADIARRLKGLAQIKATDWPAGASLDDIERSLARFEADVGRLAAQADKLPAAAIAAGL